MIKNKDDKQLKRLKKFAVQYEKLLAKFPDLEVSCDRDEVVRVKPINGNTKLQVWLSSTYSWCLR
jgi:hypothetical protein